MLGSTGRVASPRGTLIDSKYTMTLFKKTENSSTPTAMLYKVVQPFEFVDKILKCDYSNEQYFPVVLSIKLPKVVLTFGFVDEILKCDHSNESYRAVLFCGAVATRGGSSF